MRFADRPPSMAWEPVVMPDVPNGSVWAWFKPPHAPQDIVYQVPDEICRTSGASITVRRLIAASGMDIAEAHTWTILGMTYPMQSGANPLLDQPVPPPGPVGIAVHMVVPVPAPAPLTPVAMPPGPQLTPAAPAGGSPTLEAMDADWQSIIQLERQLDALRRQLGSIQGTLQSLNRDLDSDERLYSDTQDKKEWHDTRRWLRDALAQVSKAIRAYDIGVTSAAGSRRRFEEIYKEYIEPRRPFPGMEAEQYAFEQHRKDNQSLIQQMQSAHAFAARDGVQRAQMVLSRIAAKVRRARAKR